MLIDNNQKNSTPVMQDEYVNIFRPTDFDNYFGQIRLKEQLKIMISSAVSRNEPLDHVLLFGLPGMGKTTIAQLIGGALNKNVIITSGQALVKTGDVASLLTSLKIGDILFIDEIHRLKPKVEEMLYTAMEDFAIDLVLGKGPTAKVVRLDIPKFTLLGATTKLSRLANPFKDRFGLVFQLEEYTIDEIINILKSNLVKLSIVADDNALHRIAVCSRGTPRVAIHFLKRARDFLIHQDKTKLMLEDIDLLFKNFGLDNIGLTIQDRLFLSKLYYDFEAGPVGISTISAAINDDKDHIEDIVEPFLIRLGFLQRTHRGRQLTVKGIKYAQTISL